MSKVICNCNLNISPTSEEEPYFWFSPPKDAVKEVNSCLVFNNLPKEELIFNYLKHANVNLLPPALESQLSIPSTCLAKATAKVNYLQTMHNEIHPSTTYWFLALTYFNIVLPTFVLTTLTAFWMRVRDVKEQTWKVIKSLFLAAQVMRGARVRAERVRGVSTGMNWGPSGGGGSGKSEAKTVTMQTQLLLELSLSAMSTATASSTLSILPASSMTSGSSSSLSSLSSSVSFSSVQSASFPMLETGKGKGITDNIPLPASINYIVIVQDDGKGKGKWVLLPPALSAVLFGLSLIGNLDLVYRQEEFVSVGSGSEGLEGSKRIGEARFTFATTTTTTTTITTIIETTIRTTVLLPSSSIGPSPKHIIPSHSVSSPSSNSNNGTHP
ncbi:hypothetical protein GYMLUDRAFT_248673 [Collybiopsis luxurians FD-317 M1]|uniref:Uncharacterized protein n=1 Tax=Collybiopsis luxurians FD-317 M1 TaxID=944289 RepID=A0A0D0CK57_9AGAR|nr:hypothetical protein GYMLUDRAFT_248673 [Collybiopsis luxurians FD-317 M1]